MTGGVGVDRFIWDDGDFGAMTVTGADRITDFTLAHADRNDLSLVDADTSSAGSDEAFTFIGSAAFSGVAGELRTTVITGNTYVQGDTNGDAAADFWIRVDGVVALTATQFTL